MVWKENRENAYCEITPAILALKEQWEKKNYIDPKLYKEYNVKRGLRDEDGRGVLTGLTRVGEIQSYSVTEGEHIIPQDGMLYYRGIDCRELVKGSEGRRFAFEETAYLLLFGELPTAAQLEAFCQQLASYRTLPTNFFRDVIMKAPPRDLMNTMQRAILTLFCYDDKPNDIGLENVLRQSLQLMSNMPVLAIYAYQAWRFSQGESLFIHVPKPELSTAENFLRMLREDCSYTELEARVLDVALVLHADHGGGNNSTFTNHVVTSSGTDTYSAIAAAMASLKGPRHGGGAAQAAAALEEHQVVDGEPGAEAQRILAGKSGGFVQGGALPAHHAQGIGEQPFAHAGLQAVHADDAPFGKTLQQALHGDQAGLVGARKPAGKGQVQDVLPLLQKRGEGVFKIGNGDLAGGGHAAAAQFVVEILGRHLPVVGVILVAPAVQREGHGQHMYIGFLHKIGGQVAGRIGEQYIVFHSKTPLPELRGGGMPHT